MGKRCIGIDVGGALVKIGLFEVGGISIGKWEVETHKEEQRKYILEDVVASIRERLANKGIELSETAGAGIGAPGLITPDGYVEARVDLGWKDKNSVKELRTLLGVLIRAGNGANVVALGKMWQGDGKGCTDIMMVTPGTGVGGDVTIDEKTIAGEHGLSGEIGCVHIRDEETEYYNCGDVGCVERVAPTAGITREVRRKMVVSDKPPVLREFGEHMAAKNVLGAVEAGDELVVDMMEVIGHYLGLVLSWLALTMDPEIFVTGGGVSKTRQFLIDVTDKHYDKYMATSENRPTTGLATPGNDVGIYGTARLILD